MYPKFYCPFPFGTFFSQDVAFVGLPSFDFARPSSGKSFGRSAIRSDFRHVPTSGLILSFGGDDHYHLPALKFWVLFNATQGRKVFFDSGQHVCAQLLMGHFASPKTQCYLYLISVLKEVPKFAELYLVVAFLGARPEFNFFDLNLFLFSFGRVPFLILVEEELAEVHHAAHRGLCCRNYFHKI